ncbi:hypothetical protein niasHT_017739 [Heterodera trifolii]|uniref:Nematode cuticle collagen N-terminal domain-containing protein n=1 Tax=Heterodera trifolii TaxID=157864 RepID=A0ABD2L7D3_9BILA
MFTHNERHGVFFASVLSTVSLMAVVVLLPIAHQHFQHKMSMMLSNVQQCQHQSAKLWHQLITPDDVQLLSGTTERQKRRNGMPFEEESRSTGGFRGSCCACTQGPPGLRGPPGRDGFNGKDAKPGTLGYPGRPGKYIPAPPIEQTSCQMCNPGPQGPPGVPGPKGARGHAGQPGKAGKHGENNHQGPPGPQGARGEPGQPGKVGPAGDRGRLLNGAAPGRAGQMGSYGPRGTPGPPGKDGQPGGDGARGMRGPTGDRGDDGSQGPQGPAGMPGLVGEPGGCGHCQRGGTIAGGSAIQAGQQRNNLAPVPSSAPANDERPVNAAVPLTVQQQQPQQVQQQKPELHEPQTFRQPAAEQSSSAALGQQDSQPAQTYKAQAHAASISSNVPKAAAQIGRPAIPLPMAPPGQMPPYTVMPIVTVSGKFVGSGYSNGNGGGYGAAVMAANQNEETMEYVEEMQQDYGQKANEATKGKK